MYSFYGFKSTLPLVLAGAVVSASPSHASSIVGSWYGENLGQSHSTVVATFLNDGHFFVINVGDSSLSPGGQSGLEYGTYNWNSATGAFTSTELLSTVGDWTSVPDVSQLTVSNNTLQVTRPSENNPVISLSAVPNVADSLLGTWREQNPYDFSVFSFLANGQFYLATVGAADVWGQSGIEVASYHWDNSTGAISFAFSLDTNGGWGASDPDGPPKVFLTSSGNQAIYTDGVNVNTFDRVAPVPLPAAIWLFLAGAMGIFGGAWRRKA